ncbi:unnamed protein product [Echinostoma caproni]|uniref:Uncharacterized protein n=1 Tax=Echinostoma caproni TaxID=27848 RepID=A0A183AHJ4_9TREM|nr:unnamed protein product [Echinostoma caproni]
MDQVPPIQKEHAELSVQTSHGQKEDKMTYTVSCQDFGMQFDDILMEDAFIFRDYVIGRDGIRHVEDMDWKHLSQPLANQGLLPPSMDTAPPPVIRLDDILQSDLTHEENQFLSVCSVELSEWDVVEQNQAQPNVPGLLELSKLLRVHSHSMQPNATDAVQKPTKTDSGAQYDLIRQETPPKDENACTSETVPLGDKHNACTQIVGQKSDEMWLGDGPSRVRLDVVKALSELDTRLSAVDRVSSRLQEEYRKNQEFLEHLIRFGSEQQTQSTPAPVLSKRIAFEQPLEQDQKVSQAGLPQFMDSRLPPTAGPRASSLKRPLTDAARQNSLTGQISHSVKPRRSCANSVDRRSGSSHILDPFLNGQMPNTPGNIVSISGPGDLAATPRKSSRRTSVGSLSRKREQARKERNSALHAKRCADAAEFANEAASQCRREPMNVSVLASSTTVTAAATVILVSVPTLRIAKATVTRRSTMEVLMKHPEKQAVMATPSGANPLLREVDINPIVALCKGEYVDDQVEAQPGTSVFMTPSYSDWLDEEQTTIISEWSIESDVKRLLYETECKASCRSNYANEQEADGTTEVLSRVAPDFQPSHNSKMPMDTDQFTDGGAPASSSFIDWEEVDELIQDQDQEINPV